MAGEQDAEFVAFAQQVSPRLLTAAWMLTGDPSAAEGLVQEALEPVHVRWRRIKPDDRQAYARRSVATLHTALWRGRQRDGLADLIPDQGDRQESRHLKLIRALQTLSPREREVVVLQHYLDQSDQETADALRIRLGTVHDAGSRGLAGLRAELEGSNGSAWSDQSVLEAMDRAAADPPLMHVGVESVLAGGRAGRRRRHTAAAGMALAAVTVATALSLGSWREVESETPEDPAVEATTWDESIDFEAPMEGTEGVVPGFGDARIERAPGADHFTVTVPSGDERLDLERIDADLPGEVELFRNGGDSLVVARQECLGEPILQLATGGGHTRMSATDGGAEVYAWPVEGVVDPESLLDVYWLCADEMVASSGTEVLHAAISVDGFETRVAIVPERGVWSEMDRMFTGVHAIGEMTQSAPSGDGVIAVLPGGARDVEVYVSADVWGANGAYDQENLQIPLTLQTVGDYTVGAAALSESAFDREVIQMQAVGVAWTDETGALQPDLGPVPLTAGGNRLSDGAVQVRFDSIDEEVVIDPRSPGVAVAVRPGGSWVMVSTVPKGMEEDAAGWAFPVIDTEEGVQPLLGWSDSGRVEGVKERLAWVAVGVGDGPIEQGIVEGEPLPTVLFSGPGGPWWSRGTAPEVFEVDGTELAFSIQDDLGLWAVQCLGPASIGQNEPVVGKRDTPTLEVAACVDFARPEESGYVVAVLPNDVARRAAVVLSSAYGGAPVSAQLGQAQTIAVGHGQSLWVVRVSAGDQPLRELAAEIEGLDLDGDGAPDLLLH